MEYLASFVVIQIFYTLGMSLLINQKINLKSPRFYISFFVTLLLSLINVEYLNPAMRVVFNFLIYMIYSHLLFKTNLKDSIILGMLIFVLSICSEFIYVTVTFPFQNYDLVMNGDIYITFINNLFIGIILYFICSLKRVKGLHKNIIRAIDKINQKKVVIFALVVIVLYNLICWIAYFVSNNVLNKYYFTLIGFVLGVFCSLLIYYYFKTVNKYLTIFGKYNMSLKMIRDFELALDNYRISTHENKNQLKTIRNMSKDKKVESYIDALLNDSSEDNDEKLLNVIQKIPDGGLKGIIYTKLVDMKRKGIPYELVVDKKITADKISKIDDVTLTHICEILGVFLDNAIDASLEVDDVYVAIELYDEDGDINVSVSNGYKGYIDIDSMNQIGLTTKGSGHGYGLSLANYLINKDPKLEKRSEVTEDSFTQIIKIKV